MISAQDQQAIAHLEETFALQKAAYLKAPCPSLKEREELLMRIPAMLMSNAKRIAQAMNSDYGYHPELTTYMFDVANVAGRAQFAASSLKEWMARDYRPLEPSLYGSSKAYIENQPKGVIGNMPAWNFPVDLSIGPLCEMLAAGNRVIIKPSEQTPAVGEVLAEMVAATFDRDRVSIENGGVDLARHFSSLQWDHLLYTGNTAIGREVMLKAAENLVPVTLELGGKNPTVFTPEAINAKTINQMMGAKLTKNGQLCITVDHCLVPSQSLDQFVALVREYVEAKLGDYTSSDFNCAVINKRQFDRLQRYVDEAKTIDSSRVIELGSPASAAGDSCTMPLTLVINPAAGSLIERNEAFGPILSIITYDHFDEAIAHIQAGERPLGIYIFSEQPELVEKLRLMTSSGGFCVNAASLQGAQENLGFGGVGKSGMGRHHGLEGFREFSNPRGCVELTSDANTDPFLPPHDEASREFLRAATGGVLG
ncbi:MAG: aldehyde dehydrogenase family protein [Porticoccaceae bacterium]